MLIALVPPTIDHLCLHRIFIRAFKRGNVWQALGRLDLGRSNETSGQRLRSSGRLFRRLGAVVKQPLATRPDTLVYDEVIKVIVLQR